MTALMAHLRARKLGLAAQVHSHPGRAFHSEADDAWASVRHEGALSVVVPNFAAGVNVGNFLQSVATFRLSPDDRWLGEPRRISASLGAHMTITPAQENERMLARALGIGVDEAAVHLGKTVAITTGAGEAAAFATELSAQLERTVRITAAEGPCDLEVVIHAPMRQASKRLCVALHDDGVTVSGDTVQETRTADGHGVQRIIEACYAASVVLSRLIEGLDQALRTDPFQVSFSALGATRAVLATPVRLEDAGLVGAGAVGNGFLRAARHLDIGGTLTVVDPKVVGRSSISPFRNGGLTCRRS
jgi:hypothetical protein